MEDIVKVDVQVQFNSYGRLVIKLSYQYQISYSILNILVTTPLRFRTGSTTQWMYKNTKHISFVCYSSNYLPVKHFTQLIHINSNKKTFLLFFH